MPSTLKMPLTVRPDGSLATLVQDSTDDITQAVAIVLATTQGERAALPAFGIPSQIGRVGLDEVGITDALNIWEPRATDFTLDGDSANAATNAATMSVRLGTTTITVTTGA